MLQSFRQLPLRMVLTVPFVFQTVGLAAVVGYLSYQNGQKSVNELVQNLQQEIISRIRDRLDDYFAIPLQINQSNVDAYELGRLDLFDFQTTGKYFRRQLEVFQVSFINFATIEGEFVGVGTFGDGKTRMEEIPLNTKGKSYQYSIDAKGNRGQLLSVQEYDPFAEAWFANTLKTKKPNWSEIYNWDGFPQIMSISANYPVYRQSQMVGVVGVDLKLSKISDFLSQLKIGKSGKAFVLERSGLVVASSVSEPPFLMVNGEAQRLPAIKSQDLDIRQTTATLGNFSTLESDRRLSLEVGGQKKYVQIVPWRDRLGLDWLVVVVIPESDFMAQIQANTQRTALLSLLAAMVAAGLGMLTARWIARPVLRLSRASQVLTQAAQQRSIGDPLSQPMVGSSIQELETLSQSFYQMGSQLQDAFAELEAANEELEDRVAQRTLDLQQANAKIAQLNEQLQADNLRMSAELDVTRRLQQMILPKRAELEGVEGLDIACFMEPAREVGGDYYDVILGAPYLTIGIGDVTGHGLESGVLAIMAQTAVRTLVAASELEPTKFLNVLNQVLYGNAQRLSPGKNMTFALFQYQQGQLQISGQHEDVLVFRANGAIERIETIELGMPLGMMPDIQDFASYTQIHLEPGDGVVLYTDGIPEAEGKGRSLYGLERLIAVVRQHWAEPAEEIQQRVIEDVRSHIGSLPVYDDITLVILKKT
jgi:sigma-B regulation protein RsbU (phosphoserine phosphatase)